MLSFILNHSFYSESLILWGWMIIKITLKISTKEYHLENNGRVTSLFPNTILRPVAEFSGELFLIA